MSRLVHREAGAGAAPSASPAGAAAGHTQLGTHRIASLFAAVGALIAWASRPAVAAAHGTGVTAPLTPVTALTAWAFDPLVWATLAIAGGGYLWAVRRVDARHPGSPVPRRRVTAWFAGLAVILVALQSSLDVYADSLFSVHMVQHLLLTMVAAPLLALGAPITLLLRVTPQAVRRGVVLPVLHSRVVRLLAFPVLTWVLFSGYMWLAHFSPLFDAALESPIIHEAEHALFLVTAMLFWWPVVGADPAPWRLPHPARIGYLFLGMPWSSFLGLAIFSAPAVLYPHYATLRLGWGPSAREDQAVAGGIMWAGGDLLFLAGLGIALWVWLRAEDAKGVRLNARLDHDAGAGERLARDRARVLGRAAVDPPGLPVAPARGSASVVEGDPAG